MREKSKEMDPPRRMTGRGLKERIGSGSLEDTLEDKNLMEPPEVRLSRWNGHITEKRWLSRPKMEVPSKVVSPFLWD